MKKILVTTIVALFTLQINAQDKFDLQWKSEFPVEAEWRMINEECTLAMGGDLTEIAMMDGTTGKILWKLNFKEKFGQKKAKDWSWDQTKGVVEVVFKGDKKDQEITNYINEKDGSEISKSKYDLIEAPKTKTIRKSVLEIEKYNTDVTLLYEKKTATSSMGKGTKGKITVKATGDKQWSTDIEARYLRSLCSNAMAFGMFGGDFLKLMYANDKIFVIYEGLSVLDINIGKVMWQASFDNIEFDFGAFKSIQTLGRAGYPLVSEDAVYLADLSDKQHRIKKYDLETGKVLWQSEQFEKDDIVPDMKIVDGVLVAQFGGRIQTQTWIQGSSNVPESCKNEFKFAGNAGVKAYDTQTGKILWQTSEMKELNDKFSSAVTNLIVFENTILAASDKNLYAFDIKTGKPRYTVPMKKLKIGNPVELIKLNTQTIIVQSEEGIASLQLSNGTVNYATNTNKCFDLFNYENAYFIWNGKSSDEWSSFVRIDIDNGQILGKMEDTPYPNFTNDGAYFIKFDGSNVMRYKTSRK